jgi:cyclophilin family peptidyl-prolyl cis-trans isomerase
MHRFAVIALSAFCVAALASFARAEDQPTTKPSGEPQRKFDAAPPMQIDANKKYTAIIDTSKGKITAELFPKAAPETVNSFVFLARKGYFNGLKFHRVIPNFMVQGGDPYSAKAETPETQWGTGGPGYTLPEETDPEKNANRFDKPGMLAMARQPRPHTAGSQFFITVAATPHLQGGYTIFGRVTDGQEVANAISLVPSGDGDKPKEDVVINSVTIKEE